MIPGVDIAGVKAKLAKAGAMIVGGLALAAVIVTVLWLLTDRIADGGEAIGREQAQKQTKEKGDAENAARRRVRDCRDAGGLWDDAIGQCAMRASGR